jgi:hypothetical protein
MAEHRTPSKRNIPLAGNEALYDGVPKWMESSIWNWLSSKFKYTDHNGKTKYHNDYLHDVELHCRLTFGSNSEDYHLHSGLYKVFTANTDYALDILQAAVEIAEIKERKSSWESKTITHSNINGLNDILIKGGSKWHIVVDGSKARMESRVDSSTISAFKKLANDDADFSKYLKIAWEDCFGRSPDLSGAYSNAIKAVEAATWRVITPNNMKATLGTMLNDFKLQSEAGKFNVGFKDKDASATFDTAHSIMQRLWKSQTDRHATGDYSNPSQLEAESAVYMSITICQMFTSGLISRKKPKLLN